jgi:hypothetical protein
MMNERAMDNKDLEAILHPLSYFGILPDVRNHGRAEVRDRYCNPGLEIDEELATKTKDGYMFDPELVVF